MTGCSAPTPIFLLLDMPMMECCTAGQRGRSKNASSLSLARMEGIGLSLHPEKTKIIYVGRSEWKGAIAREFTFLGYDLKQRVLRRKDGMLFYRVHPVASMKAKKGMTMTIRSWLVHRSSGMTARQLAKSYNSTLQGTMGGIGIVIWVSYMGLFSVKAHSVG
jgi:RNA-directed DNA polymerase